MYPYLLIYIVASMAAYSARLRNRSRALAIAFTGFLVLFAGTRVQVGCDYNAYRERFQYGFFDVSWWEAFTELGEGAFHVLNFGIRDMGFSYATLLLTCAVLYMIGLSRFAQLAQRPLAFLALSFPVLVLQLGMSGLRQALATAFLMLALRNFIELRKHWVAIWIIVASQFHTSAIIFLPIVLLVGRDVSTRRILLSLALMGPVVAYFLQERLEIYSARYVEQVYGENSANGAWLRYALVSIPLFVYAWKRRLVAAKFPQLDQLLRLFFLVSVALVPIGLLSSVALHRIGFYVMPVSILALLCVTESIFDRRSERLAIAIPFLVYGVYILMWFLTSRHANTCYVPYQSWLLQ